MAWDFETDADFQLELDWMEAFVREHVEPLDLVLPNPYDVHSAARNALVRPLQDEVRRRGLWACHLSPELGGQGFGQLKLALMNEVLGRSQFAPTIFGCQAPDSGNAEILAKYGTAEQKDRYLKPLLANEIVSCFAMTEPQGGADPTTFTTRARLQGDRWIIDGEKWFASNADVASFFIVMAVTDPDAPPHQRLSAFIAPAETPGIKILRNMSSGMHRVEDGSHSHMVWTGVDLPADSLLGPRGGGFIVAQTRLGGGRIHHAMRTLSQARRTFDQVCERVLSRTAKGGRLADLQLVQDKIADSWIELEQFRLLLLHTAWKIDRVGDYRQVRKDIAAIKVTMPKLLHDISARALHLHGSLGMTPDMPFTNLLLDSYMLGLADGPTEVHKVTIAREVLKGHQGVTTPFPSGYIPPLREAARRRYADQLDAG